MKKVMYFWINLSDDDIKQQIDAAVAAAVFDTEPMIVVHQDALASDDGDHMNRFNSLALLDREVIIADNSMLASLFSEVDHVVSF